MNALLIEQTLVMASTAPGKLFQSSVVCFQDSFYIILHVPAYTFHVNEHPEKGYNFGDRSITEGLKDIMASCSDEAELKSKLGELVQNNTLIINFGDYKKVKINGFFGVKTLKASNSALSYVSFNATKDVAKQLVAFYPNL